MGQVSDIRNPDSVRKAIAEYNHLGQAAFLSRYGFKPAKRFLLKYQGSVYDSKAILGVAHKFEHPERGPLRAEDFSGGEQTWRRLGQLGFNVVVRASDGTELPLDRFSSAKMVAGVEKAATQANKDGAFDPTALEDARERIIASIAKRQGQPQFRRKLIAAYGGRCAISGCNCPEALEAAHIHPFTGVETHHVANGLLLRSDIHTLFDLGLIGIESESHTVLVAAQLRPTDYQKYAGKKMRLPVKRSDRPNAEVLDKHRATFGL